MQDSPLLQLLQLVSTTQASFCKFLSANDTGETGGHQAGILVSKSAKNILFSQDLNGENIVKRSVKIHWQNDITTSSIFTYYNSKKEFRITKFGKDFPYLTTDQTGSLFVLIKNDEDDYSAFFIDDEDNIECFLNALGISPTETNRLIDKKNISVELTENAEIQNFIHHLSVEFPSADLMSTAARTIHDTVYNNITLVQSNPDKKLIDWTNTEYALFRALEQDRYGSMLRGGFSSVDDFINKANIVLNRRKSRAGRSLENHLEAIFKQNKLLFEAQVRTEVNKKPDFLFPSGAAYHNFSFPEDKLITLAAKTTCKDRWRQIINEADRLKNHPKFLCTLQQGISSRQMDEMETEKVILVVPKDYIHCYPSNRRDRIWTLLKFIEYVREIEK